MTNEITNSINFIKRRGTPLYHLFNTKRLKVTYSPVPNMQHLISRHNYQVLRNTEGRGKTIKLVNCCNCIDGPASCPLQANRLIPFLVYEDSTLSKSSDSAISLSMLINDNYGCSKQPKAVICFDSFGCPHSIASMYGKHTRF